MKIVACQDDDDGRPERAGRGGTERGRGGRWGGIGGGRGGGPKWKRANGYNSGRTHSQSPEGIQVHDTIP
jgi:hypothetical protein